MDAYEILKETPFFSEVLDESELKILSDHARTVVFDKGTKLIEEDGLVVVVEVGKDAGEARRHRCDTPDDVVAVGGRAGVVDGRVATVGVLVEAGRVGAVATWPEAGGLASGDGAQDELPAAGEHLGDAALNGVRRDRGL